MSPVSPEHSGGHRGAHSEDLRHRRARGLDRRRELLLDVAALDAGAAQAGRELPGQYPAGHPGGAASPGSCLGGSLSVSV